MRFANFLLKLRVADSMSCPNRLRVERNLGNTSEEQVQVWARIETARSTIANLVTQQPEPSIADPQAELDAVSKSLQPFINCMTPKVFRWPGCKRSTTGLT